MGGMINLRAEDWKRLLSGGLACSSWSLSVSFPEAEASKVARSKGKRSANGGA